MADLRSLSAREAARQIAERRITAEALVTAYLDRIAAREAVVGAWQYLDREQALATARQRDAEAPRGPLHGVPIAVKDLIDTVDMPTAYGSAIYRGHRPAADASCVALARAAGAIVVGKTVTTEVATFTPGKTANPRKPRAHSGRLLERLSSGGRRWHGAARLWHANRGVGNPSGSLLRLCRLQAELWIDQPGRRQAAG